ncbi:uncharacterized protein GIQ15_04659 [Arthroderma uncinatum]|uniref:uncharacterized protein n=1 Tax=Arthroderma uncinatum TaxID=74035 RepID=UPI00144AF84F|nr:uncharacterized protein GIQ15_04659 [Arthroderma uncinatum]KAF3481900.1 hypothetical protein GIQ15_04659 [Arthroderma uncinatum]
MPLIENTSSHELASKHWQSFLHGFRPCHFPGLSDGPPATKDDFQETTIDLDVNNQGIQEFCHRHHVTSGSLLQTAWAIVINCYAGVEDVSFGYYSTEDGFSSSPEISNTTIICRTHITAESPLGQTMVEMKRNSDNAWAHRGYYSISDIQKLIGLEDQPLFNAALNVQREGKQLKGVKKYDILARVLINDGASISVSLRTRTSKFSAEQTADIAHTFGKSICESLGVHPDSMVGDLDIFSKRDHEKVMQWNKPIHRSVDNTFHQHFEEVAREMPDSPAICSWDGNFTYHELDILSSKLANHLADLGVVQEALVLLCFDKSAFAIVSMLGIMKAGGAFVAIDPTYPASRIQAILQATKASIVVAEPAHCHLFEGIMEHVVAIDSKLAEKLPLAPKVTRSQSAFSNTAYVVFTSGSTGSPKGVMVEHRALCTAALGLATPMRINSTTRHLNFAAFTFDLSYGDIFVTLSQGACLCLPSEHERVNDLAGAMVRMNVNSACLIPSVARIFQPDDVPALKTLSLGGEALVKENLELWASKVALNNMYGPSECTVWCCSNMNLKTDSAANNIGRGVGALLWITSPTNHDHLCPVGCIGELLIEGPVMARGYIDPEQTKKSFTENPRWAKVAPGQRRRFYKTGDLVKYNQDGTVSFIGRKDTQVKFNGRRIETGEIEYHLASHDLPRQSIVILPSAGVYAKKLVAVVVLKSSPLLKESTSELRALTGAAKEKSASEVARMKEFLSTRVPYYMLPQFWVVVEDIPLMISGKMNRVLAKRFVESLTQESLKEQEANGTTTNRGLDDSMELRLREIWSDILNKNVTDIGADQSFGSLGGDSFSAMEIVARCKAEDLALAVHDFRDYRTIRQLVSIVKTRLPEITTNGRVTHDASRAPGYPTNGCATLQFPPVWWDLHPALASC